LLGYSYYPKSPTKQEACERGDSYDNAAMESFWSTLKNELVHRCTFASRAEARSAIFECVEVFHNRKRLHGALDFMSPVD
jgi:putative transposase